MTKIIYITDLQNFNGSCFIKKFVEDDQIIMKYMTKIDLFLFCLKHFVRNS